MRKDLKIGMAIGAVLLVVLIVYLAVPKSEDQIAQNTGAGETPATDTQPPQPQDTGTAPSAAPTADESKTPAKDAGATPPTTDPFAERTSGQDTSAAAAPAGKAASDGIWANALEEGKLPVTTVTPQLSASGRTNADGTAITAAPKATDIKPGAAADANDKPAAEAKAAADAKDKPADATSGAGTGTAQAPAAAAEKSDTAAATAGRPHKVQGGETYSSIAKLVYGDSRYYLAIEKANPNLDPARLKPGTVINLPEIESVKGPASTAGEHQKGASPSSSAAKEVVDPATEYKVQSGDSLHKIATKRYGSSLMADKIYELNKALIGDNAAHIKPGMILKMPPNPNNGESEISSTR